MKLQTLLLFFTVTLFFSCKKTNDTVADCSASTANISSLVVAHQMKGWELYSWPACNDWYYAILPGTNSLKSYDEVTGKTTSPGYLIKVFGKENLKAVLLKFPVGENLFWASEGWLKKTWGSNYSNLQLPPAAIVNELQQYAIQAGLNFTIAY
jgi:hypothetical protein